MILRHLFAIFILVTISTHPAFAQIEVKVKIVGLNKQLEQNVRLSLSIEQQKNSEFITEGRLKRLHKNAPMEISKALQPFGYYQSTVNSELIQGTDNSWEAIYQVSPGKPVPVGTFDVELDADSQQNPDFAGLLENFPLKPGRTFNHLEYEKFKNDLGQIASEQGYINAHFTEHRVEIDLQHYQANIYLHFVADKRFRFGEVVFSDAVLDDQLLRRFVPFKKGDAYTLNGLIDLQQALNDTDYFSKVEVSPGVVDKEKLEIPVNVLIKPRKRHRINVGLGYGTDTGQRTKIDWQFPRLNSRGHKLNTDASVSQLGYSLGAQYRIPVFNPRTDQFIFSTGVVNEKTDSSESTVNTIGMSLNQNRGNWRESISLNYQLEDYTVAGDEGKTSLLLPGINWSRVWGARRLLAIDGIRLDIAIRLASSNLYSDVSFSQLRAGIKSIHPLTDNSRLILRGEWGRTYTSEFDQLPSSVRFFAGGSQSVRGYKYQSLGPLDETGEVVGGQYLLEGTAEFEYSLNDHWGLALFMDAGNALDNLDDPLQQGAGFGVRWQSPVGPVRIDFASAINQQGEPWRLHINIGPDL